MHLLKSLHVTYLENFMYSSMLCKVNIYRTFSNNPILESCRDNIDIYQRQDFMNIFLGNINVRRNRICLNCFFFVTLQIINSNTFQLSNSAKNVREMKFFDYCYLNLVLLYFEDNSLSFSFDSVTLPLMSLRLLIFG